MKLEKFYNWLKLNKKSEQTIQGYFNKVNAFGKFCDYNFTQENIEKYMVYLKENKSSSAFNSFINAMKSYCEFSKQSFEFPKYVKTKKRSIKYYFTEEKLNEVLKYIPLYFPNDYNERDLILRFMFYTGARPSDVENLTINNIEFNKGDIYFINGKGEKDRVVPFLNQKLYDDLKQHCKNKEQGKVFNITYHQLIYMMKKIKKELNIDGVVEPRTMRISFAKWFLNKEGNILILMKLLGHNDIKTTEIYAEPDERMVKQACEKIRKGK